MLNYNVKQFTGEKYRDLKVSIFISFHNYFTYNKYNKMSDKKYNI